jgi:copper chaperone CopZ
MKISDCAEEVERVTARVSGVQNVQVYEHETSINL